MAAKYKLIEKNQPFVGDASASFRQGESSINTRFKENFMIAPNHPTLKNIWANLVAAMGWADFDEQEINQKINTRQQFRFAT